MREYLIPALFILALSISQTGHAQSFDCRKAETETEWAICNTPELSKLDTELAATYQRVRAAGYGGSASKIDHIQISWMHGQRDLCNGDVECLIKAYHAILATMNGFGPPKITSTGKDGMVPDCGNQGDVANGLLSRAAYAKEVCSKPDLLRTAQQIDAIAQELRTKLPQLWQAAFDAQQRAFSSAALCRTEEPELADCVATVIKQRLQDLQNLAASLDRAVPECTSSEFSIRDSDAGDAAMSHTLNVYLIEYRGTKACTIRGYPAISVVDSKGTSQPGYAVYSGSTYFFKFAVPPLPVTFSKKSRTAWFAIETTGACDPGFAPLEVKISLPNSHNFLRRVIFPNAACPKVVVTPIAMISTLESTDP